MVSSVPWAPLVAVKFFALSPDNLKVGFIGRNVSVFDLSTKDVVTLIRHSDFYYCTTFMCFSGPGDKVVCDHKYDCKGWLKVFDVVTGRQLSSFVHSDTGIIRYSFPQTYESLIAFAWGSPNFDGRESIICSYKNGRKMFDLSTGECVFSDTTSVGCSVHVAKGCSVILM